VAVNCALQVQWMKNQCPEFERGSEWDWNNWYRSVSVAPAPERTTLKDLSEVQRAACDASSCTDQLPPPSSFINAMNARYDAGPSDPRATRFRDNAGSYGAAF